MMPYPPRVPLAHTPTPLDQLRRLGLDLGVELYMKRDDLTGSSLSGNKVRKLEFLLADAVARGADTVLTCGGAQSNHCRATAIAAAKLGMPAELSDLGNRPYIIPEGGSNALGAWGYVRAAEELAADLAALGPARKTSIVYACGSGGTGAGLTL